MLSATAPRGQSSYPPAHQRLLASCRGCDTATAPQGESIASRAGRGTLGAKRSPRRRVAGDTKGASQSTRSERRRAGGAKCWHAGSLPCERKALTMPPPWALATAQGGQRSERAPRSAQRCATAQRLCLRSGTSSGAQQTQAQRRHGAPSLRPPFCPCPRVQAMMRLDKT